MKYFIMAWDDDAEPKKYHDFYFLADKRKNLILFNSVEEAEELGRKTCKYFRIDSWHNYMCGENIIDINKLILIKNNISKA